MVRRASARSRSNCAIFVFCVSSACLVSLSEVSASLRARRPRRRSAIQDAIARSKALQCPGPAPHPTGHSYLAERNHLRSIRRTQSTRAARQDRFEPGAEEAGNLEAARRTARAKRIGRSDCHGSLVRRRWTPSSENSLSRIPRLLALSIRCRFSPLPGIWYATERRKSERPLDVGMDQDQSADRRDISYVIFNCRALPPGPTLTMGEGERLSLAMGLVGEPER